MPDTLPITLRWMHGTYAVCRLRPDDPLPDWIDRVLHHAGSPSARTFVSVTRTPLEMSVVMDESAVQPGVQAQRGMCALTVVGQLDFSVTGILSRLSTELAAANIPVFAISTFDTDILLIPADRRAHANAALQSVASWTK